MALIAISALALSTHHQWTPLSSTYRTLPSMARPRAQARASPAMLFKNPFANDPNLEKSKAGAAPAGKKTVEISFSNGRTVNAFPGQGMADVARAAGAKIRYDCKNGDCGTCTVKLNGRAIRACVAKVPTGGPFTVQVGDVAGSAAAQKTKSLQDQLKAENARKKKGLFG